MDHPRSNMYEEEQSPSSIWTGYPAPYTYTGYVNNPDCLLELSALEKALSPNNVVETASSRCSSLDRDSNPEHVEIGNGSQGVVFEQSDSPLVIKKEHVGNGGLPTNLGHEFWIHGQVLGAFDQYERSVDSRIRVPQLGAKYNRNCSWWLWNIGRFPVMHRTPSAAFTMERILPVPISGRRALVWHFYPRHERMPLSEATINDVLNSVPNKHCLVRPYLGMPGGTYYEGKELFLRNFPLFVNSMVGIGLDVVALAKSIGRAFATMHWGAGVDGNGVEFVLGTSMLRDQARDPRDRTEGNQERVVSLFMLDFGKCAKVEMRGDVETIYQAFSDAMITGDNLFYIPYYREHRAELYTAFKEAYARAAGMILEVRKVTDNDRLWLRRLDVREFMKRYEAEAEDVLI
ncbi:hypothetical protein PT974_00869 [Cladobotryum mycophilum]|uniref:DUF3669 domain-containing protein n=1 Tax=Cladobotryum mycophilum TaxID=491253 RepID=A0ABR0T394_9HYPO